MHLQVTIHFQAMLKGAGFRGKGHRLELLHAQFHQHKVRPALVQVAEEHQADSVEQGHVLKLDDLRSFIVIRQPIPQGPWFAERFRQQLPHLSFSERFRVALLVQPTAKDRP